MSERALKFLTTTFVILGIVLMLAWPKFFGHVAIAAHPTAGFKRDVLVKSALFISALFIDFFLAIVSAWLLIRKVRLIALEESRENLKMLMEGVLRDHHRGGDDGSPS